MPKKILVVDDDTDNRLILVKVLSGDGYDVVEAVDGVDAVERARCEQPDVILMDLALPNLDGWEAARRIRADVATQGTPIIALTAFVVRGGELEARRAGCNDYLAKPARLSDIRALVGKYTRGVL